MHKNDMRVDLTEYVYFQIFKFYRILSFLCSQKYKEFHIKNLHASRFIVDYV
jgi:hypothetical protein